MMPDFIDAALAEPEGGTEPPRPNEGEWGDDDPPTGDEALRMGWPT